MAVSAEKQYQRDRCPRQYALFETVTHRPQCRRAKREHRQIHLKQIAQMSELFEGEPGEAGRRTNMFGVSQ